MTVNYFQRKFAPNRPLEEVAALARDAAAQHGLKIFGSNVWWVFDSKWSSPSWEAEVRQQCRCVKIMGGEYLSFQVWLREDYLDCGGSYRRDDAYLAQTAQRIDRLHQWCWEEGVNCYIESHVARVTEDLEACSKLFQLCEADVEVNGDLSHYLYRNIQQGPDLAALKRRVEHTHQRLCRPHGDLSADVADPQSDWQNDGLTWQAFEYTKPCLLGGLSSRVIAGESGPAHLVQDPLTLDAKLVPLYRLMAKYADASAQGQPMTVDQPTDAQPFS